MILMNKQNDTDKKASRSSTFLGSGDKEITSKNNHDSSLVTRNVFENANTIPNNKIRSPKQRDIGLFPQKKRNSDPQPHGPTRTLKEGGTIATSRSNTNNITSRKYSPMNLIRNQKNEEKISFLFYPEQNSSPSVSSSIN